MRGHPFSVPDEPLTQPERVETTDDASPRKGALIAFHETSHGHPFSTSHERYKHNQERHEKK
jgi:hypothetical protein